MYSVAVKRDFVAEHFLIGGDWGAENDWHWQRLPDQRGLQETFTLDQHGDRGGYRRDQHSSGSPRQPLSRDAMTCWSFRLSPHPSLEHFARNLRRQHVSARIPAPNLNHVIIKMWENETTWAAYHLERSCASASSSTGA